MANLDLGKQVGPLPLGAWMAVVAVGGGIALYSRKTAAATAAAVPMTDLSGDVGVGTGEVGGWTSTTPATSTGGVTTAPTDNATWGQTVITWLIASNYDAAVANSAITKALSDGALGTMSIREWALWKTALMHFGAPPEATNVQEPGPDVATPVTPTVPVTPATPPDLPVVVSAPAVAAPPAAPAGPSAGDNANMATWLRNAGHSTWKPDAAVLAVFALFGRTQEILTASNNWLIAQNYYNNFHRPAGWKGPNAVTAAAWLKANGYAAP